MVSVMFGAVKLKDFFLPVVTTSWWDNPCDWNVFVQEEEEK